MADEQKTVEKALEDLVGHMEKVRKDKTKMTLLSYLTKLYNECNIKLNQSTLFELFCKCAHNSNSLALRFGSPGKSIGTGLYLGYSAFRHSCSPNITRISNGMRMEIRASKEINVGEEMFTKFIQLNQDKKSRQIELKRDFYFDCRCQKCSSDFDQGNDY